MPLSTMITKTPKQVSSLFHHFDFLWSGFDCKTVQFKFHEILSNAIVVPHSIPLFLSWFQRIN